MRSWREVPGWRRSPFTRRGVRRRCLHRPAVRRQSGDGVPADGADVVAQAVSWLRAEQTGTWYVGGNCEIGGSARTGGPPGFDAGRIGQLIQLIGQHNAAWEAWFTSAGIRPHRVSYEELDAGMAGVTLAILDFLGLDVPDERVIVPRHQRQADGLTAQWIERYRLESAGS